MIIREDSHSTDRRGMDRLLLMLMCLVISLMNNCCSADRPNVGDWYTDLQGKKPAIQIAYLGSGHEITEHAKGKGYRYISGAGEYEEEHCFAYEDSQQILWERIHFLVIQPVDNLRSAFKKSEGNSHR